MEKRITLGFRSPTSTRCCGFSDDGFLLDLRKTGVMRAGMRPHDEDESLLESAVDSQPLAAEGRASRNLQSPDFQLSAPDPVPMPAASVPEVAPVPQAMAASMAAPERVDVPEADHGPVLGTPPQVAAELAQRRRVV